MVHSMCWLASSFLSSGYSRYDGHGLNTHMSCEDTMNRGMGALTPPGFEYMEGRTVQEIEAIREEAEATGKTCNEVAAGDEWKKRLPPN
jgi:hypothetical protein